MKRSAMDDLGDRPLSRVARALRRGEISVRELVDGAIARHAQAGDDLRAYKLFDAEGARDAALRVDERLARLRRSGEEVPPLLGIPVSVKDLYGVEGFPTFAGTPKQLPPRWSRDAWLVGRLRAQGAIVMGKTHTVELALGAVGINPHWDTPRNPWDASVDRIPGGSSSGAGVSLWEGSARIALGSDTGGSIRIPASMTGTVGHRSTKGLWPTDGVVPLSPTLDTVGALTRSVEDSAYFFASVDQGRGDSLLRTEDTQAPRVGIPRCDVWGDAAPQITRVLEAALDELAASGWKRIELDGALVDEAGRLYLEGAIAGAECQATLERDLAGWRSLLHPIIGSRLAGAPTLSSTAYTEALAEHRRLASVAGALFEACDILALPTVVFTPPPLEAMNDLDRYLVVNRTALWPTAPASILGLCALSMPVGLDAAGMPVGLQLVGPAGADEGLLRTALAAERVLGTPLERLGRPPRAGSYRVVPGSARENAGGVDRGRSRRGDPP